MHYQQLRAHDPDNIVGMGHGPKLRGDDNRLTDNEIVADDAIQVFVERKVSSRAGVQRLDREGRLLPEQWDGRPVDVIPIGHLSLDAYDPTANAYPHRRETVDPLVPGIQIQAEQSEGVGCAGPLVELDGTPAMLTNRHVARPSDVGDAVYHPTKDDGRKIGEIIASPPIVVDDETEPVGADVTAVEINPSEWLSQPLGDDQPDGVVWEPEKYDAVTKSGRTTGITEGFTLSTDAELELTIEQREEKDDITTEFGPLLVYTAASAGGDSGSAVIHDERSAFTGLHFAGGALAVAIRPDQIRASIGEFTMLDTDATADTADPDESHGMLKRVHRWLRHL